VAGQQPIHAGDVFGRLTAESLSNVSDNGGVHLVLGQFSNLEDAASARRCAERTNEVGAVTTRINRSGVSPNMGQPGEVRSCPDSSTDCTSAIRSKRAGRSASIPKRPRVTIIMPEEATP
jgi:hypothetical protein